MKYRRTACRIAVFVCSSLLIGCALPPSDRSDRTKRDSLLSPQSFVSDSSDTREQEPEVVTESNDVLTLRQALALTVMHNPELKVFSLETRAAQARQLQAGLLPNPELNIEAENVGGTGTYSSFDAAETTVQLSQLIEVGHKTQKRKKVASLEKELAGLDYQDKQSEIFSEAAKAFIAVLAAQEKLILSNELLKLSEESFQAVDKRVYVGKDASVEKNRAAVALAHTKLSHQQVLRDLDYAKKQLALFWGQTKPVFQEAAGNLEDLEPLPALDRLANLWSSHPDYRRAEAEIAKSRAVMDLENAKRFGDVTLGAGIKRFHETDDNAFVLGISIPLPLSDRNQGGRQEASYNLAKAYEEKIAAELRLQNELHQIYQDYTNAYSQAAALKAEVLPAAAEMFHAAARAYQEGKTDYLNLLDAQRTFFDIKTGYIDSLAACHTAVIAVERFVGRPHQPLNSSESEK